MILKSTRFGLSLLTAAIALTGAVALALAADGKPNILVTFGDDIGTWNVGAYTHGMMGRTPKTDSLARSGAIFTDHYGQASCTAGRAGSSRDKSRFGPARPPSAFPARNSGFKRKTRRWLRC